MSVNSPAIHDEERRGPSRRAGRHAEVAGLVSFLLSDASAYIAGQNPWIDGGLTRGVWGWPAPCHLTTSTGVGYRSGNLAIDKLSPK